jgi:hypothetical protein
LRLRQIAEGDERHRIAGDDAGILQPDQREEKPDAGGDAELQIHRDRVDQPGAQRRERQREEEQAREEHASERKLPIAAKLGHHHGEGEIGVEAHAGGERDRIVGVKPHDDGAGRCGEAGGDEHRTMVHAGLFEDRRVDKHDVGHGEEGGEPGAKLGRQGRARRRKAEDAVERPLRRGGAAARGGEAERFAGSARRERAPLGSRVAIPSPPFHVVPRAQPIDASSSAVV